MERGFAGIFDLADSNHVTIVIEEGYVDIRESAGIYRSPKWDFPSQYLEIVRDSLTRPRRAGASRQKRAILFTIKQAPTPR